MWSSFGRDVVLNLTTVSNSVRGFSVLLIGRYLAQDLLQRRKIEENDCIGVFLRFEQIAAYVRELFHKAGGDIRGIERVRKYTRELDHRIPIGDPKKGEILGDQKTYGLWGLFTVPARASGLLPVGSVGIEPEAADFVRKQYLPHLKPALRRLEKLLVSPGGTLALKRSDPVCKAVAAALPKAITKAEQDFFGRALRDAALREDKPGIRARQAQAAALIREAGYLDTELGRDEITRLCEMAENSGAETLALRFRKILALESLIAVADRLFAHLCARNGHKLGAVESELSERWGDRGLPGVSVDTWTLIGDEFAASMDSKVAELAHEVLVALSSADWRSAILALLAWNKNIMQGRKGAPWVTLNNGKLDVAYQAQERRLPERDDVPDVWRNSYFLDSLRNVTKQLEGKAA